MTEQNSATFRLKGLVEQLPNTSLHYWKEPQPCGWGQLVALVSSCEVLLVLARVVAKRHANTPECWQFIGVTLVLILVLFPLIGVIAYILGPRHPVDQAEGARSCIRMLVVAWLTSCGFFILGGITSTLLNLNPNHFQKDTWMPSIFCGIAGAGILILNSFRIRRIETKRDRYATAIIACFVAVLNVILLFYMVADQNDTLGNLGGQ